MTKKEINPLQNQKGDHKSEKSNFSELNSLLTSILNSTLSCIFAFKAIRNKNHEIQDFECLIYNEKAKQLLGKTEADLLGNSFKSVLYKYFNEEHFEPFKLVAETGEPLYLEQSYIQRGVKTWFSINITKLNDGIVVVFTNISLRKDTEDKLRRNQAKLKAVLENTEDYIWSFNNDYIITTINTSFQNEVLQQTGHLFEVGCKFDLGIFSKEVVPQWESYFKRAFIGERFTEEVKINAVENEYIFEYSFNPIRDNRKSIIGVSVFGRNITNRRKTEEEIRKKSQMLNNLLQNLPVFVFRLDSEGKIIEALGSALSKLHVNENQLIGLKAEEIFPEVKDALKKVKSGRSVKFQSAQEIDGQECVFEKHVFPDQMNAGGAIGFAMDVSELKGVEAELKNAKEVAERANKAKNYFLANMSHDLRTPIHTILGFARTLRESITAYDSLIYLQYVISSADLLYKLVDDILQLTKMEEGKLELNLEPFNFKESLLSNLYPYEFQAKEKGLDFHVEFSDQLPGNCIGDAGKISRIIINLISNSIKFTKKGNINVNFLCLNTSEKGTLKKIKIVVKDTGIGVSKEKHDLIFNSFTQAELNTNSTYGGSGLGLAIVKDLVYLMGGSFGVESPINEDPQIGGPGPGSAFWIIIPLEEVPEQFVKQTKELQHEDLNYGGDLKVLVVEDNMINQQLAKVMLLKIGCEISVAENGNEAIEILKSEEFDVILMDVQMPLMDGMEATKIIRKKLAIKTPVIGLSANIYKEDIENCFNAGMDDYLGKPFSEASLHEKIFHWAPKDLQKRYFPNEHSKEKLTDITFLIDLYNGDMDSVKDMIKEFFKFQSQLLKQIEDKLERKHYHGVASLAHSMRSSLKTIDLNALHEPLVKLEENALHNSGHQIIKNLYNKITSINEAAKSELKNYI